MDTINVGFDLILGLKDSTAQSFADDVIVYDNIQLGGKKILNPETTPPVRLDASVCFLCKYGEISFFVDYKSYRLTKGMLLSLNSRHILTDIHISSTYEGYALIMSQKLIQSIVNEAPSLKKLIKSTSRSEPLMEMDERELKSMVDIIERIKEKLGATNHSFQGYLVKNEVSNFLLEAADMHLKRGGAGTSDKENRKDEVVQEFIRLIFDHCKEQHEITFYAKALCMTPGNLSRTVTAVSGKSPMQWLSSALIAEAKILLRKPDSNIKQVSEELHFSDQSSFGKFFKKHTGLTPIAYRNGGGS